MGATFPLPSPWNRLGRFGLLLVELYLLFGRLEVVDGLLVAGQGALVRRLDPLGHRQLVRPRRLDHAAAELLLRLLRHNLLFVAEEVDFIFSGEHAKALVLLEQEVVEGRHFVVLVLQQTPLRVLPPHAVLLFHYVDDFPVDRDGVDANDDAELAAAGVSFLGHQVEPAVLPDVLDLEPLARVCAQYVLHQVRRIL